MADHPQSFQSGEEEQPGSSAEWPIRVHDVMEEYAWLDRHFDGYEMKSQSLQEIDDKAYDILTIRTSDGEERSIYFDISSFFGCD